MTRSETDETMPAWSPRGDTICFVRKVGNDVLGRREIRVMDTNGNRQMRLDYIPYSNIFPAWSPQGDKIAFVNWPERLNRAFRIYTIDMDGQNKRLLFETSDGEIRKITWSPDGRNILFTYHSSRNGILQEICLLDVITRKVNSINLKVAGFDSASWAPIGKTIMFSAKPVRQLSTLQFGIFLMDADGNSQELLWDTFIPEKQYQYGTGRFSWSPDGQSILFSRGNGNLYVTELNGGGVTRYLNNAHSPDWKTPISWRSVTPENKLQTTWGAVKK